MKSDPSSSLNEILIKPFKEHTSKTHKEHASKNTIETTSSEFSTLNSSTTVNSIKSTGSTDKLREISINSKESTTSGVNYVIDENHWRAWKPLSANNNNNNNEDS